MKKQRRESARRKMIEKSSTTFLFPVCVLYMCCILCERKIRFKQQHNFHGIHTCGPLADLRLHSLTKLFFQSALKQGREHPQPRPLEFQVVEPSRRRTLLERRLVVGGAGVARHLVGGCQRVDGHLHANDTRP